MRWTCKIAAAVATVLAAFVIYAAVGNVQSAMGQRGVSVIDGLAVAEWNGRDEFWYVYGILPKKMNIEVDDVVRHILEKPAGDYGTPRGYLEILRFLVEWLDNDPVGRVVYERCYGGTFVDAARIYIVVTDPACKEKIAEAVGDLAKKYGTEVVFLKGKYTHKQLSDWANALVSRLLQESTMGKLSQICGNTTPPYADVDRARNLVVVQVQPKCLSPTVVRELGRVIDELGIPREAVLIEDRPGTCIPW